MNIVLIVLESLRKDCVNAYGQPPWGKVHTPHLDAFARESVMFTRAYPEYRCRPFPPEGPCTLVDGRTRSAKATTARPVILSIYPAGARYPRIRTRWPRCSKLPATAQA